MIYTGVKKRWIEGEYGGNLPAFSDGIEIRSSFFARYLGRENVKVPNVGFFKKNQPKPLIIATDLLLGKLDSSGNQIPGETNGLYYPTLGDVGEPTLSPLRSLLESAYNQEMLLILPGDQHENAQLFDPNGMTTTVLEPDLSLLSDRERKIVNGRFMRWIGRQLPAGIWREIFMEKADENPRGDFQGKEERNFLPHCTEGIVEYIPEVINIFNKEKTKIEDQINKGEMVPVSRVLPIPKDGLTVDMPGDRRGMNGNKFDEILQSAFMGAYFQGDHHRRKKVAVVAGACYEYSVRLLIEHLVDADINVVVLLTAVKGLDFFSSKLHTAHYLKELYGKKLFFTYDWLPELLGQKPRKWDEMQKRVENFDGEQHNRWWQGYVKQMQKGVTSMDKKIIIKAHDVRNQMAEV